MSLAVCAFRLIPESPAFAEGPWEVQTPTHCRYDDCNGETSAPSMLPMSTCTPWRIRLEHVGAVLRCHESHVHWPLLARSIAHSLSLALPGSPWLSLSPLPLSRSPALPLSPSPSLFLSPSLSLALSLSLSVALATMRSGHRQAILLGERMSSPSSKYPTFREHAVAKWQY